MKWSVISYYSACLCFPLTCLVSCLVKWDFTMSNERLNLSCLLVGGGALLLLAVLYSKRRRPWRYPGRQENMGLYIGILSLVLAYSVFSTAYERTPDLNSTWRGELIAATVLTEVLLIAIPFVLARRARRLAVESRRMHS